MGQISIIVVTADDVEALQACLASLRQYTSAAYELILVHNGAAPLPFAARPDCRIIETGHNLGFARAVNRGLDAVHGEHVLLLQADTRLTRDIISEMLAFMQSHPQAGVVGAQLVCADGRPWLAVAEDPQLAAHLLNLPRGISPFSGHGSARPLPPCEPVLAPRVDSACLLLRRSLIDAIGGLDEGFFCCWAATDFCKRAAEHGFEVWLLPGLTLIRRPEGVAGKPDPCAAVEFFRSRSRFFRKHGGRWQVVVLWLLTVLQLAIASVLLLLLSALPRMRAQLQTTTVLLAWHLLGMPASWGSETVATAFRSVRKDDCTWFATSQGVIPVELADPDDFLEDRYTRVLKASRTTHIKVGVLHGTPIYFKRYNYRGLRDVLRNFLWFSRARHCFEIAQQLPQLGLKTPEPFLACEKRKGWFLRESYLATRAILATDLSRLVKTAGYTDALIRNTARFVHRLHDLGVLHGDLKDRNLLLGEDGEFYLIDLDRCCRRRFISLEARARNLSYLNATFFASVPPEKRHLFLDEYVKGDTMLERKQPWFARRLAAHTIKRLAKH